MIVIRNAAGQIAELNSKSSIKVERFNPLFTDDDKLFQDLTYSFKLPASPANNVFFNNGYLIELPNQYNEMQVTVDANGVSIFGAILVFKIVKDEYEAVLKVNFGAVANKIKSTKMVDIITRDGKYGQFDAAYMKTVAQNPKDYPYCFFPVYNPGWNEEETTFLNKSINQWVHYSQQFLTVKNWTSPDHFFAPAIPFFKVKHVLKEVLSYLGFQAFGGYIENNEYDKHYIYSRFSYGANIFGSTAYLPSNLSVSDFLKVLKARFKIVCFFDLITQTVQVETAETIFNSANNLDLSEYVTEISEFEPFETKGYSISLKPDDDDEAFNNQPTNKLIVGDGSKSLEIEASTLKENIESDKKNCRAYQLIFYKPTLLEDSKSATQKLRFMKYNGMKTVAGGEFPESEPLELNSKDGKWYQFLIDSKNVRLSALIPVVNLKQLNTSEKITFRTKEGAIQQAIINKVSFELIKNNDGLIEVEIECNTLTSATSSISVQPVNSDNTTDEHALEVMAYYKPDIVGFSKFDFEVKFTNATNIVIVVPSDIIVQNSISSPTDSTGANGEVKRLIKVTYTDSTTISVRTKVMPKELIANGKSYPFTFDGEWWITANILPPDRYNDNKPLWIKF